MKIREKFKEKTKARYLMTLFTRLSFITVTYAIFIDAIYSLFMEGVLNSFQYTFFLALGLISVIFLSFKWIKYQDFVR